LSDNLIFVSCGQRTEEEKQLGKRLQSVIDDMPGFHAYFAESVHDLEGLNKNIFDALQGCAGAVIILHDRGIVYVDDKKWGNRSSVWVNQELSILAYRRHIEARDIPILVFADPKVKLEGAMTALIVNPLPLGDAHAVISEVKRWLSEKNFASVSNDLFMSKWDQLPDSARKVVACLIDEGGKNVKEAVVRRALVTTFQLEKEDAAKALRDAKPFFMNTNLVELIPNIHSGDELSVHPTWEFQLRRQIANWRKQPTTG